MFEKTLLLLFIFLVLPGLIYTAPIKHPELKEVCSKWRTIVSGDTYNFIAKKCNNNLKDFFASNENLKK